MKRFFSCLGNLAFTSFVIIVVSCGSNLPDSSRTLALPGACLGADALDANTGSHISLLRAALSSQNSSIENLIVFGDSLSDTGNLKRSSNLGPLKSLLLPPCVYWKGRFSNGPVWLDYLASALAVGVTNYAVGGAMTKELSTADMSNTRGFFDRFTPAYWQDRISRAWIDSLSEQVDHHVKSLKDGAFHTDDLVFIWIGANNYLNDGESVQNENGQPNLDKAKRLVDQAMDDIEHAALRLHQNGYKSFAIATIPELAGLPVNPNDLDPVTDATYFYLTRLHNKALKVMIDDTKTRYPELNITLLKAFSVNQKTIEKPELYGFTDIKNPCYKGSLFGPFSSKKTFCDDDLGVKLWDWVHPNTKMHCVYANQFLSDIAASGFMEGYDRDLGAKLCLGLDEKGL
jgi:phospholipase/lecithinase/hemolysin